MQVKMVLLLINMDFITYHIWAWEGPPTAAALDFSRILHPETIAQIQPKIKQEKMICKMPTTMHLFGVLS